MASTESLTRTIDKLTTEAHKIALPSGKEATIFICKTKHLPILLRLLATVFEPLNLKLSQKPAPGEITAMLDNVSFVLNLASANFPLVLEAARTLTTFSEEDIENLDIDDLVAVIDAIIRKNYDFFMQRLLPLVQRFLPAEGAESKPTETTKDSSTQ